MRHLVGHLERGCSLRECLIMRCRRWIIVGVLLCCLGCSKQTLPADAFVVLLDSHPKGLDPRFPVGDASAKMIGLLHAGLVSADTKTGSPELELAQSIKQRSPTTYDITLKPNLTFHDGKPLTSADVEYTFMELGSELVRSPLAGLSRRIKRFTIHSKTAFTIELHKPHAPFMLDMGMGIVPKHICGGLKQCPSPFIGAGPFAFVKQDGNHTFVYKRFDDYVGGAPKINHLVFRVVKDDNARLLALLGNAASLVQNAVSPLMLPVVQDKPRLQVQRSDSFKYTYLAFNLRDKRLADIRVRKAIAHGLDRKAIIHHKYRGLAKLSSGLLSPAHWAYEPNVQRYAYDPKLAMKLLDEAGLTDPDGDGPKPRLELELKVSSNKFRRALARLMAHQLARIGIKIRVRAYEWGTYFADIKSGNFQLTTLQWPSILEPGIYRWIFHSSNIPSPERRSAGANRGAYINKEIDQLLDAGMIETDQAKRKAIYSRVQVILARELPYVSLWHEDNIAIMKRGTKDYYATPNARFEALKQTSAPPP